MVEPCAQERGRRANQLHVVRNVIILSCAAQEDITFNLDLNMKSIMIMQSLALIIRKLEGLIYEEMVLIEICI